MHIEAIDPKKTAMIVVDMQNDFVASGAAMETPAARHIVPQLAKALRICRETGIKIIYTAHVHRSDGEHATTQMMMNNRYKNADIRLEEDMRRQIHSRDKTKGDANEKITWARHALGDHYKPSNSLGNWLGSTG